VNVGLLAMLQGFGKFTIHCLTPARFRADSRFTA